MRSTTSSGSRWARSAPFELDDGDYVVYAERGGGEAVSLFVDDVRMRPAGQEGADEIEFEPYVSEFTYDFGNHTGRAQLTFEIDETGEYDVRVGGGPGTTATTAAFGPSVASDLVAAIVGGFVIAGIGIVLGIILLIVTGVRRRKFRQRAWLGAWNGPGGAAAAGPLEPATPGEPRRLVGQSAAAGGLPPTADRLGAWPAAGSLRPS